MFVSAALQITNIIVINAIITIICPSELNDHSSGGLLILV